MQIEKLKNEEKKLQDKIEQKKKETFAKMNEKNNLEVETDPDEALKSSTTDTKDSLQTIEQNQVDICINIDLLLSAFKYELNPKNQKFNVYDLDEKDIKIRHKETMENLNLLGTIVTIYHNNLQKDKASGADKNDKFKSKNNDKGDKK